MTKACTFQLNRRCIDLHGDDPTESLLRWLKRQRLAGTKEGCADGDCGACTVALVDTDEHGRPQYRAVNSCLLPMGALPGRQVLTVEALSHGATDLHPVQQALVDEQAPQCGYCMNGIVVKAAELLASNPHPSEAEIRTALNGHLCRCGAYPSILRAVQKAAQS